MGVNHLKQHAARAAKGYSGSSGVADSAHTTSSGSAMSFARRALRGNGAPGQPEHGGARAGSKGGQPKIGKRVALKRPPSGGRAG